MSKEEVMKLCRKHGILFTNRSYGYITTRTISLDVIDNVVHEAITQAINEVESKRSEQENPQ